MVVLKSGFSPFLRLNASSSVRIMVLFFFLANQSDRFGSQVHAQHGVAGRVSSDSRPLNLGASTECTQYYWKLSDTSTSACGQKCFSRISKAWSKQNDRRLKTGQIHEKLSGELVFAYQSFLEANSVNREVETEEVTDLGSFGWTSMFFNICDSFCCTQRAATMVLYPNNSKQFLCLISLTNTISYRY